MYFSKKRTTPIMYTGTHVSDFPLKQVTGLASKETYRLLNELSEQLKVPMSTLIMRAVQRELQYEDAFSNDTELPGESYELPTEQSLAVLAFITKHPDLGIEHLMECKNMMTVQMNNEDVKAAIAHLLAIDKVELIRPIKTPTFNHPTTYRVVRLKQHKIVAQPKVRIKTGEQGPLNDI